MLSSRCYPWLKYANWKSLLLLIALVGIAFNGVAWMQAYAMTHYLTDGASRTAKPEALSLTEKVWVVMTGVRVPRPHNRLTPESVGLAYETHTIEVASFGHDATSAGESLEAWYAPAPQSKGIVLLFPPYAASKQALLAPGKSFHELGYDVFWVDFRGVGGSSGGDTTLGVREGVDVAQSVRYVKERWPERSRLNQPMILYGASLGAVGVMRAIAHENITPTAAILESPFDSLLGTIRHRFSASGIPAFPSAELLVMWGSVQHNIDGFAHNPVEYAAHMNVPVLMLHGEADTRVSVEDAKNVYEALPRRKQLVLFSTVGHGAFSKDDPVKWTASIQQFLE